MNPLLLRFKNECNQLLVFCFHGLFDSFKEIELNHIDPQTNMTVSQFQNFIDYFLQNKYQFITPQNLISGLKNDQRYAMITFDDGYYNNYRAVEVLTKYKVPGVFFISTKNIIKNESFWWDIIYKYRSKKGSCIEKIHKEQQSLKRLKHQFIEDYIFKNFGIEAFKPWSDIDRPFYKSEIRNLSSNPFVTFENHTHNHSILTNCSKEEIKDELVECNKILLEITGTLPTSIAFPNGNFNQTVLEVTKETGIQFAFTTEPEKNLFPIQNNGLALINRYITDLSPIRKFGGACRLGYQPHAVFHDLKTLVKSSLIQSPEIKG